MKLVFIAGPYIAESYSAIDDNIQAARAVAIELANAGIGFFCPHLHTAHFELHANADEAFYKAMDLSHLVGCDALLAIRGFERSAGTRAEIAEARSLGIPVFFTYEENYIQKIKESFNASR